MLEPRFVIICYSYYENVLKNCFPSETVEGEEGSQMTILLHKSFFSKSDHEGRARVIKNTQTFDHAWFMDNP